MAKQATVHDKMRKSHLAKSHRKGQTETAVSLFLKTPSHT